MTDLFETPEKMPPELRAIFDKSIVDDPDELDYPKLEALKKEVEAVGYTFDYYLDAIPFDLRPIN